jgi:hypothetical protein
MSRRLIALIPLASATMALAGCAPHGAATARRQPLGRPLGSSSPAAPSLAPAPLGDPPGERGGVISQAAQAAQNAVPRSALSPSPVSALRRYATAYINWRSDQLPARERQLAGLSIGAARLAAQQTAATASGTAQLIADHVANHGEVVAISPGEEEDRGEWIVVTDEHSAGTGPYAGLPAGLHVTVARVAELPGGWAVSSWRPET